MILDHMNNMEQVARELEVSIIEDFECQLNDLISKGVLKIVSIGDLSFSKDLLGDRIKIHTSQRLEFTGQEKLDTLEAELKSVKKERDHYKNLLADIARHARDKEV